MIKNIVFDLGNVLIRFDEENMVGKYVSDKEDALLLRTVILDRLYWDKLDAGTLSDEEAVEAFKTRLPERLWAVSKEIYYNWIYNIPPIEGMEELVRDLKRENRVRLFLLSNISTYFAENEAVLPILSLLEKRIYSAVCGMVKPNREMFEYLCKECDILPKETLFIDDNAANIAGAQAVGITGYLFDGDAKKLRAYIQDILK